MKYIGKGTGEYIQISVKNKGAVLNRRIEFETVSDLRALRTALDMALGDSGAIVTRTQCQAILDQEEV